jgi:hypothetical protein
VNLICVQTYPSIVTVVANGCDLTVSPRTGKRLESPPREQQPMTSHHRADASHCIIK